MVRKGGNGANRGKFNQRGRPNGGGMNDYRNRSQPMNGARPSSFGGAGQPRPTSRFSNPQNGSGSYQPRPYNTEQNGQAQRSAYVPRTTPSSYPPKTNGSYFDAANPSRTSADQPKFNGFATKPPTSAVPNAYGQSSHQNYPSVMASGMSSMYNLPPPAVSSFSSVQSVPFNYPPPVLPVKN